MLLSWPHNSVWYLSFWPLWHHDCYFHKALNVTGFIFSCWIDDKSGWLRQRKALRFHYISVFVCLKDFFAVRLKHVLSTRPIVTSVWQIRWDWECECDSTYQTLHHKYLTQNFQMIQILQPEHLRLTWYIVHYITGELFCTM